MTRLRMLALLAWCGACPAVDLPPRPAALNAADFLHWFLALGLVILAIFAFAWLVRRAGALATLEAGQFRVLGAVSLGTRERAVLLQAGSKQLVLGVAPGTVQTLCVLEGDEQIPPALPNQLAMPSFAARLAEITGKLK